MVLALGVFLLMFGGTYSTPITVNYVTECFPQSALEVAVIMGVYRQVFGLSLPFFILPWKARVEPGWYVYLVTYRLLSLTPAYPSDQALRNNGFHMRLRIIFDRGSHTERANSSALQHCIRDNGGRSGLGGLWIGKRSG